MAAPLFTIITPSFQAAGKLEATLASVLAQPAELFEFLVIDGGSTDGTVHMLRRQDARVQWVSEPDSGIYDAMNKGIARARGRFLYFLGAGDTLRPGILAEVAARLPPAARPGVRPLFFYGNVFWTGIGVYAGHWQPARFSRGCLCHQAVFYEKTIFEWLGSYDTRYPLAADYVLNIQIFGDAGIEKRYADLIIADYEGGGRSATADDPQFFRDAPALLRRHLGWKTYLLRRAEMLTTPSAQRLRFRLLTAWKSLRQRTHKAAR